VVKGVSRGIPSVSLLWSSQRFHCSPLHLYLPPPSFQQLSEHILISSTCTGVLHYHWCSSSDLWHKGALWLVDPRQSQVLDSFLVILVICTCCFGSCYVAQVGFLIFLPPSEYVDYRHVSPHPRQSPYFVLTVFWMAKVYLFWSSLEHMCMSEPITTQN
jgi:hypothetical protein